MHTHTPCTCTHIPTQPLNWNWCLENSTTSRSDKKHSYSGTTTKLYLCMDFQDSYGGPHCNAQCPENFLLAELDSNNWSLIIITFFVVCITAICGLLKVKFWIWLHSPNNLQDNYDEKQKSKKKKFGIKEAAVGGMYPTWFANVRMSFSLFPRFYYIPN